MHSENAENSDSDTSLPDITEIFSAHSKDISPGDIVWAKFKHLYWPALVRAHYPNKKRISIWYCDEPGKTFTIPVTNVYPFHDSEMYKKILKDVKKAGVLKEHEGLTSHASAYLRRKLDGYKDDARKFFDQTYPFFLVEEMLKNDPNADVSDIKIRPMYIDHTRKQTIIRKNVSGCNSKSDDSELESVDSDAESKISAVDFLSEVNVQLQRKLCGSSEEIDVNEVDLNKIIKFILSGKADNHLKKIKLKKVPSEHRDLFEESVKSVKKKNMKEVSFTGPINDDSKLRELIFYLLSLYKKISNTCKKKIISSLKSKAIAASSFNNGNNGSQFVASVFLPESIIFAISKVKNISLSEAKRLFVEKSECRMRTIESILACVDQNKQPKKEIGCIGKYILQSKKEPSKKVGQVKSNTVCDKKEIVSTGLRSHKLLKLCDGSLKQRSKKGVKLCDGSLKQKRSKKGVYSSKEACINKLDAVCDEKDAHPSKEVYIDKSDTVSVEKEILATGLKLRNCVKLCDGSLKPKRSKKNVPSSKTVCIDNSDTICDKKEIVPVCLRSHKGVKLCDRSLKQKRSKKDVYSSKEVCINKLDAVCNEKDTHPSKEVYIDKSDTVCVEKEIVATGLKLRKCVKLCDGSLKPKRSKKNVSSPNKVCIDNSDTICDKKEIVSISLKSNKCVKLCDRSLKRENKKYVHPSKKMCIDNSGSVCDKKGIATSGLKAKAHKHVNLCASIQSSDSKN